MRPNSGSLKKGDLMPQEIREKISDTMKERKIGKKENNCQYGHHPWNWKGGITPLYKLIRGLPESKQWSKQILQRDNFTCQECGIKNGCGHRIYLHAHHKNISFSQILQDFLQQYSQFSPIEDKEILVRLAITYQPFWDIDNGITFCEDCHFDFKKVTN